MSGPHRAFVAALFVAAAMWPVTAATAGGGCHGGASQGSGDTVRMVDACFTPSVLHVDPGTEVTFVNDDPMIHDVGGTQWFSPGELTKGDVFSTTFREDGIYPFACSYHAGMTGAVVVGDGMGAGSGELVRVSSVTGESAGGVSELPSGTEGSFGWAVTAGVGGLIAGGILTGLLGRPRRR